MLNCHCQAPAQVPSPVSLDSVVHMWLDDRYEPSLGAARDAMASEDVDVVRERQRVERLYAAAFPGGHDSNGDGLATTATGAHTTNGGDSLAVSQREFAPSPPPPPSRPSMLSYLVWVREDLTWHGSLGSGAVCLLVARVVSCGGCRPRVAAQSSQGFSGSEAPSCGEPLTGHSHRAGTVARITPP